MKGFAIVPYIQGIAEPIRRVLNNCGIKVEGNPFGHWDIFLRNPRIAFRLIRKHMLYTLYHAVIARKYIWVKQNASFCTRLTEHQRAVSNFNSSKSALAEHVCETSHNIVWEDSKIITTNNRYGQRLCLEAWHINASHCALNRDDGSHLPQ